MTENETETENERELGGYTQEYTTIGNRPSVDPFMHISYFTCFCLNLIGCVAYGVSWILVEISLGYFLLNYLQFFFSNVFIILLVCIKPLKILVYLYNHVYYIIIVMLTFF